MSFEKKKTGTTILSAITTAVDSSTEVVYSENPDGDFVKSNNFSYAIVVVGEHPYAESQGDSLNLTIADSGASTINNVWWSQVCCCLSLWTTSCDSTISNTNGCSCCCMASGL